MSSPLAAPRARATVRRTITRVTGNPLVDGILAGNDLHANTRDLAAKMARSGTHGGAIVNFLRGLMDSSAAPRDQPWQDRYDNLPRQVDTIAAKIEREAAAADAAPTLGLGF